MLNHPDELLKGIQLARIACGLDKAYYGIEKNKQDAIDLLNSKDPSQYGVEIVPEDVKYPQGGEKSQIKAITNREVKPGGLPSGVGCCVISTQTAYAIYRACYDGVPCYERVMTIAGSGVAAPVNAQVRIGMPFRYIIEQCGGFTKPPKKLVMGGPMMGLIISNIDAVNIKGTAGLLVFTEEENAEVETPTCIHCGHCLEVCPMRLEPVYMYKFFMKNDFEGMQKYHITDCIECGCCSYNCPGKLPLTHSFKTAKILIANRKAEEKARAEALAKEAEKK
jgi:electron transport complex protein RnfC